MTACLLSSLSNDGPSSSTGVCGEASGDRFWRGGGGGEIGGNQSLSTAAAAAATTR